MTPDERLLYLARLVEQVPPKLLVMFQWFSDGAVDEDGDPVSTSDCGTAACAAGHATRCPAFHDEGLGSDGWMPRYIDPRDPYERVYEGFDALERFFGLSEFDAFDLFSHSSYTAPTPATVAARIRAFVAARTAKEPT